MPNKLNTELGFNSEKADASIKQTDELLGKLNTTLQGTKQGFAEPIGAINATTDALGKHGKETSKLTQFIREERVENRQRSFMFRESRDSIMMLSFALMAMSSSTGDASESQKRLSASLMTGFMAFQGADFAIKGLSTALGFTTGGVATAITAVIGLGIGLYSFFKDAGTASKEAAEAFKGFGNTIQDKIIDQLYGLGKVTDEQIIKLYKLQKAILEFQLTQRKTVNVVTFAPGPVPIPLVSKVDVPMFGGDDAEARRSKILELDKKIADVEKKTAGETKKAADETAKAQKQAQEDYINGIEEEALRLENLYTEEDDANKKELAFRKDIAEAVADLKKQEADQYESMVKTDARRITDAVELIGLEYDNGKISAKNAVAQLRVQHDLTKDKKEQEKIEREIQSIEKDSMQRTEQALSNLAGGVSAIQNLMSMLKMGSDSFLGTVMEGLNRILTIMQTIKAVNEAIQAVSDLSTILGIIAAPATGGASLAGGAMLASSGGYTGSGGRYEPAGIVHRGEVVFEKPIVDKHFSEIMNYRQSLQQSYARGGYVGGSPSVGSGGNTEMTRAINTLNANVARLSAHSWDSVLVNTGLAKQARQGRVG
ncbi:MAG: hypothetical protein IMZ53_12940 [Thermoplasmata archaeon]|nr:hypothetical protein [Thermoplasmata archaeon]